MTVQSLAVDYGVWPHVCVAIRNVLSGAKAECLLERIAVVPIRPSRAVRSFGSYAYRAGEPVCIRLQFAQEAASLTETFLHELAHLCDHLSNQPGKHYRRAHGPQWQAWAKLLGTAPDRCGKSEALAALYQHRLKLVAVCQNCGAEFRRTRRLNRRRKYYHTNCGGQLRPV